MKNFMVELFGQKEELPNKAFIFVDHFLTEFPKALRELKLALAFTIRHYGSKNYSLVDPRYYYKSNARAKELETLQSLIKPYEGITQDAPPEDYIEASRAVVSAFINYLNNPEGGWDQTSSNTLLLCSFYHYWLELPHKDEKILDSITDVYGMVSEHHKALIDHFQMAYKARTEPTSMMPPATAPGNVFLNSLLQNILTHRQQRSLVTIDQTRHPISITETTQTVLMSNASQPLSSTPPEFTEAPKEDFERVKKPSV